MKTRHWVWLNGSGMCRVAESMSGAEKALGIDSECVNVMGDPATWDAACDADVHVIHTHIPDVSRRKFKKDAKLAYVAHGTPEVVFFDSLEEQIRGGPWASNSFMILQYWLKECDATVTFWPRHEWIYRSMSHKRTRIECVPMGIDASFWKPGHSNGKLAGTPSVYTSENANRIKHPYDLFVAWPDIYNRCQPETKLHAFYIPGDNHKFVFPLVNANGAAFHAYINGQSFPPEQLRNNLCSVDFYANLVSKGDFNHIGLQASACGAKLISYHGNPYADYWVREGDQREMAKDFADILNGIVSPRDKSPVMSVEETAKAMLAIYESL